MHISIEIQKLNLFTIQTAARVGFMRRRQLSNSICAHCTPLHMCKLIHHTIYVHTPHQCNTPYVHTAHQMFTLIHHTICTHTTPVQYSICAHCTPICYSMSPYLRTCTHQHTKAPLHMCTLHTASVQCKNLLRNIYATNLPHICRPHKSATVY